MRTDDFDYELPERCIAQAPAPVRDACKRLAMDRATGAIEDRIFRDICDYLQPGDVLVANSTRVMPARLLGAKRGTGGAAEVFLLRERFDVRVTTPMASLDDALHAGGHTPLPPYIKGYAGDEEMYQTVYSHDEKSAAAPTAGLHFTPELIERLREKGVEWKTVELEVGLDTFRIVDEDDPEKHAIHTELYTVNQDVVDACDAAHERGNRVIAVGTTSVRSLESAYDRELGCLRARDHEATSLYILPGYEFGVVDALITNFHVPRSTLMMLVSAFSTRENIMAAYKHAIENDYRMLSFGDAMFIH